MLIKNDFTGSMVKVLSEIFRFVFLTSDLFKDSIAVTSVFHSFSYPTLFRYQRINLYYTLGIHELDPIRISYSLSRVTLSTNKRDL